MKKIIVLLALITAAGCTPLDRVNPTDPSSPEYIGWHFIREIGDFNTLSDFCIGGSALYCSDVTDEKVYKYTFDGVNKFIVSNSGGPPYLFVLPTGITCDDTYFYVVDQDTNNDLERFEIADVETYDSVNIEVNGDKILEAGGVLYVADADPPGVVTYNSSGLAGNPIPVVSTWAVTQGDADGEITYISDIEYSSSANRILIADSTLDRISVFTTAGVFERDITTGGEIIGIAVSGNTIFVPDETGIHFVDINSGSIVKTIADYGEGAGKVDEPGLIEVSGSNIFYSDGQTIKYFAP